MKDKELKKIVKVMTDALEAVEPTDDMFNGEYLCHTDIPAKTEFDAHFLIVSQPDRASYAVFILKIEPDGKPID